MKYALIDTMNTFFRAKHVASRNADTWEKIGMALHLTLGSVNQAVRNYGVDHVVFCLEGRSWRKDFYTPYKATRKVKEQDMTEAEVEESEMFWETYESLIKFLTEKTNVTVLRDPQAEADDCIARFAALHPNDEHIIISTDTDYLQLLSESVHMYNGVTKNLITIDGYFDDKGRPVIDKKTKEHKTLEDPQYLLFEKCMRGDTSDNVFSAYPGVRKKGTKNKTGLLEAFADKDKGGFNWNNIMLQRWTDHNEVEHRVRDDYERNRTLIDLTAQPKLFRDNTDIVVKKGVNDKKEVAQVGVHFMRFCGKYELNRISDQADSYAKWLNTPYQGALINE
jgi:5'-3' exonuclease